MGATQFPSHISHQFDKELEDIRSKVLAMGGLVEDHLSQVLSALSQGNGSIAESIAMSDYKINAMEVHIDEECAEILARRNPAASDLRLVLAVTKIITDLERIGDETEKIARMVLSLLETDNPKSYYIGVLAMGHHVRHMLHDALDAFARLDVDAALTVAKEDAQVDREQDASMRQLITYMMEDPRSISRVLDVVLAVRAMERIGDHARNICEDVVYLVKGKDIRHTRLEDVEKELLER
ncbi:MAG: phosphate signaling complex protein PhoU [Gammaproteobacteria bacterium]